MSEQSNTWSLSNIIAIVGAVLLGSGVISLVASNWSSVPNELKVLMVIILFVFLEGSGFFLKEYKKLETIGLAVVTAGLMSYGAGIFLIGQIYNLRIDWSDGLMYWFIGSGIVAYVFNSRIIKYLCIIILSFAVSSKYFLLFNAIGRNTNTFFDMQSIILMSLSALIAIVLAQQSRKSIPESFQNYL
jgi:uncharacterized membrane protein